MYNSIYNDPHERQTRLYSDVYWDGMFSDEEINNMTKYCENLALQQATTQGHKDEADLAKVRTSKVAWLSRNDDTDWIFDRFNHTIYLANERFYNFTLNGYDQIQYTTYHEDDKGEYVWHMDGSTGDPIVANGLHRKLSMTFLLNEPGVDFEGGEFEINRGQESDAIQVEATKGRCIFFPSFMIHRVKPVTKGMRKSLVIWCLGPKWI